MKALKGLKSVDIYLLDQALKDRIPENGRILDAGCGSGRNYAWLAEQGYDIYGIDPIPEAIEGLKAKCPSHANRLFNCRIEEFQSEEKFDYIICNAVLHFATNHSVFERQFEALVGLLKTGGVLFIRMTSTMGLTVDVDQHGRAHLPDNTDRYLLTPEKLDALCSLYDLVLLEPMKSVWVNGERSMATIVLTQLS